MNYFEFEKSRIAYDELGSGTPVMLVHGTLWYSPWGKFKYLLASSHRVIAIHLPGYGGSQAVPGRVHDTDLLAKALCGLVDHLGLKNAPLIGLSLGTVVAVKAARTGCVRGKLILAGMPTKTTGVMVWMSHWLPKFVLRKIAKLNFVREKILMVSIRENVGRHRREIRLAGSFKDAVNRTSPEAIADVDYVRLVKELPHTLSEIPNEKIFLYGQYDTQKTGAKAWGISYRVIKKSGHNIFYDQPEEAFRLVTRLLPGIRKQPGGN